MQSFHTFCFYLINGRMEGALDSVSQKDFYATTQDSMKKGEGTSQEIVFLKSQLHSSRVVFSCCMLYCSAGNAVIW